MCKLTKTSMTVFLLLLPITALASHYKVHNIGSVIGNANNIANAINESGEVTITAVYNKAGAYVWTTGTGLEYIQMPGILDHVSDINDLGEITGSGGSGPQSLVLRQANGNLTYLDRLPGMENAYAYAGSINNAGQIAGGIGSHAVFWSTPNNPIDISGDNGRDNGTVDLNNNGQVLWSSTWMTPRRHR
jgi:hypothetical protein